MHSRSHRSHSHRLAAATMVTAALCVVGAAPAMAYAPVSVVHTERAQAGPYAVTVGFSTWPIRALKSLDFTFMPDGGIAGTSGLLLLDGPGVKSDMRVTPLVRHPRKRDRWGLDTKSFSAPGIYFIGFAIDGPLGHGEGSLPGVVVQSQPGPPMALSWTVGSLPFIGLVVFLAVAWRRIHPGRQPLTL